MRAARVRVVKSPRTSERAEKGLNVPLAPQQRESSRPQSFFVRYSGAHLYFSFIYCSRSLTTDITLPEFLHPLYTVRVRVPAILYII